MKVEVSRLRPQDRPRWTDLWRAYLAFYDIALPEKQYDETWSRLLDDTTVHGLAARRDGGIVGITHFLFHAHCWTTASACYLQDLYVDESARGAGAGRSLIEAVAGRARERQASRMYWLTQDHNATARRLYDAVAKQSGFIRYDYDLG
ncbi:MAG TPA: GNAT family N-acetyltransferase [Acetobacteraceae bacterium]